jgi:hypothetical protein
MKNKKKFSIGEIEKKIINSAFEYYSRSEYPYIKLRDYEIWQDFLALKKSKNSLKKGILNSGVISKNLFGQKTCLHFMPHELHVKCGSQSTAIDSFQNEKALKKILKLSYEYRNINDENIITYSKVVNGSQFAANFPPSVAKSIYNNYLGDNGIVYDYSCGFGGRLLGFLACDFIERGAKYIGVEPSTKTYIGLLNMTEFFGSKDEVIIYKDVSENFCPDDLIGKIKLAFSSPPYFNKEIYSEEKTQSCHKFQTWDEWLNGYWFKTIDNCYILLKEGGYFIANIADIKDKNKILPLIKKTSEYCAAKFSKRHPNLYLFMSGFGKNLDKKKREIFLVFQKGKERKIKRRR